MSAEEVRLRLVKERNFALKVATLMIWVFEVQVKEARHLLRICSFITASGEGVATLSIREGGSSRLLCSSTPTSSDEAVEVILCHLAELETLVRGEPSHEEEELRRLVCSALHDNVSAPAY